MRLIVSLLYTVLRKKDFWRKTCNYQRTLHAKQQQQQHKTVTNTMNMKLLTCIEQSWIWS